MFKNNKYRKEYFRIIKEARLNPPEGYCEVHHIIPRSLGGTEYHRNLVPVSGADHLRLHTLLPYFTEGENRYKMLCAWRYLTHKGKIIDYEEYDHLKESYSKMQSEKMKGENNPMYGKKGNLSPHFGKKYTKERRDNISKSLKGKKHSEERIKNIKKGIKEKRKKGYKWYNNGIVETFSLPENVGDDFYPGRLKIICPHCGKEGNNANMKRYHFDNCKYKEEE